MKTTPPSGHPEAARESHHSEERAQTRSGANGRVSDCPRGYVSGSTSENHTDGGAKCFVPVPRCRRAKAEGRERERKGQKQKQVESTSLATLGEGTGWSGFIEDPLLSPRRCSEL